jgi:hypothetical protein
MNLPANIPLIFVAARQMAPHMEVRMKQRCVTEFVHAEKIATNVIH